MSEDKKQSGKMIWAGRILSGFVSIGLLLSAVMKFVKPDGFEEGMTQMGWNADVMTYLGIIELLCVVTYLIPRTAVLGAILIAAYLGGATATHVRVGEPFIIPVVLGIIAWLGIWLRDQRLRDLLPVSKHAG